MAAHFLMSLLKISCVLMVKNEANFINTTINSANGVCDKLVLLDTGSTDNTIAQAQELAELNHMVMYSRRTTFVDFATTRNELLELANQVVPGTVLLLLDASDEILPPARQIIVDTVTRHGAEASAFYVAQMLLTGAEEVHWKNIRLLLAPTTWRYKGPVHEYLYDTANSTASTAHQLVVLRHDRTQDNGRTQERFERDVELLFAALQEEPGNSRYMFYLAQSLEGVGRLEEAAQLYADRAQIKGYLEEREVAYVRAGLLYYRLNRTDLAISYLLTAHHLDVSIDPAYHLSVIMGHLKMWVMAYRYAIHTVTSHRQNPLFHNRNIEQHLRYRQLCITAFYVEHYSEGKYGCVMAIEAGERFPQYKDPLDVKNIEYYPQDVLAAYPQPLWPQSPGALE